MRSGMVRLWPRAEHTSMRRAMFAGTASAGRSRKLSERSQILPRRAKTLALIMVVERGTESPTRRVARCSSGSPSVMAAHVK